MVLDWDVCGKRSGGSSFGKPLSVADLSCKRCGLGAGETSNTCIESCAVQGSRCSV